MRDYEEKSYYEIQLDNKQLILVFLASITVCVLIFILGVMIGKGQKEAELAAVPKSEAAQPTPQADIKVPEEPKPAVTTDRPAKTSKQKDRKETVQIKQPELEQEIIPAKEQRYAYEELDQPDEADTRTTIKPEPTSLASAKEKKTKKVEESKRPVVISEPEPPVVVSEPASSNSVEAAISGKYTVQVMATSSRDKAQQQIATLQSKGYKPFLDEQKKSGSRVYKVRIGRFADTSTAKQLASKIKQDLRLDTWVTSLE